MKKAFSTFSAALLATLAPTACEGVGGDADGGGAGGPPLPIETLNSTEQASLILMREEEKLAHDVYAYLDTLWGGSVNVFRLPQHCQQRIHSHGSRTSIAAPLQPARSCRDTKAFPNKLI